MGPSGYGSIIGGTVDHLYNYAAELSPEADALRKESLKQQQKLRTGAFGQSAAQKQSAYAQAMVQQQALARQQNADFERQRAAGLVSADANQANVAAQQNAAAKTMGQIQASSDAQARNDYASALQLIDNVGDRWRKMNQKQGEISYKAATGATSGMGDATGGADDGGNALISNRRGVN